MEPRNEKSNVPNNENVFFVFLSLFGLAICSRSLFLSEGEAIVGECVCDKQQSYVNCDVRCERAQYEFVFRTERHGAHSSSI